MEKKIMEKMNLHKNEEWICPNCGEEEDIECFDVGFDWELMIKKMYCQKCEHDWREYFVVKYDGYSDNTGCYNSIGQKNEEEN